MRTCSNCKYSKVNHKADTFYCKVHCDDTPKEYGENMCCDYHVFKPRREGAE